MQVVLYVELTEAISFSYEKPILDWVKIRFTQAIVYDLDNHSEVLLIQYASELLEKAEKAVIIFHAVEASMGSLRILLEKVIQGKEKCLVCLNGHHAMLERMLSLLNPSQVKRNLTNQEQQDAIARFYANE